MDETFNPGDAIPGTETSQQKSQLLSKIGAIGGRVVEGARDVGRRAKKIPGEVKELVREAEEDNQELYDAVSPDHLLDDPDELAPKVKGGLLGKAKDYLQQRRSVRGLKEDYSTRGTSEQRYWLDDTHYIVFNPGDPTARAEAEQAIDNFKNFGTAPGMPGEVNAVIEAGETELSQKKTTRDPIVSPRMARNLADGGKYLSGATGPMGEDVDIEDEEFDDDLEPITRRRPTPKGSSDLQFKVPSLKSMGLDGRTTYKDSEMFGSAGKIGRIETPGSDRQVIGKDPGKIRIGRSPTDQELMGRGPGNTIPRLNDEAIQQQSYGPPGAYVIPRMEDILPRIEPPRRQAPQAAAPPVRQQPQSPGVYKIPRLDDIMPRMDMGMGQQAPQRVAAPSPAKHPGAKNPKKGKAAPAPVKPSKPKTPTKRIPLTVSKPPQKVPPPPKKPTSCSTPTKCAEALKKAKAELRKLRKAKRKVVTKPIVAKKTIKKPSIKKKLIKKTRK